MTKLNDQIKYYENEGKMSDLIKKVAGLETESKKLYQVIGDKDKEIKLLKMEVKVQK